MADVATTGAEPIAYPDPVPRRRSGRRILVWIVGIVVIGGMLISILLPSLCKPREAANKARCASNLHQIGLAILLYTQDNGGQYPPSLAMLVKDEQLPPAVMVCPSSSDESASLDDRNSSVAELTAAETNAAGHKHCLSYVYTGRGLNVATAQATAIVAYEPLANHQGDGTNVLFGDGHAEWVSKQEWPKLAAGMAIALPTTRP